MGGDFSLAHAGYPGSHTTVSESTILPQEFLVVSIDPPGPCTLDVSCITGERGTSQWKPFVYHLATKAARASSGIFMSKELPSLPVQPVENSLKTLVNEPIVHSDSDQN